MFLRNKNEFNTFMKAFHASCKHDPKYKVPDSWNAMAAKAAVALGKSHDEHENNQNFNINTLNNIYKSVENISKVSIYEKEVKPLFYGTIRDELKTLLEAIHWSFENEDNDIYNHINDKLEGELTDGFNEVIRLEYSPDDTLNKDRLKLLEEYANLLPKDTFRYYEELYRCPTDSQKGIFYMISITAFYAFRERVKDTFYTFCDILGEYVQDKDNYMNILEANKKGELKDFLFKLLDEQDLLLTEEMF